MVKQQFSDPTESEAHFLSRIPYWTLFQIALKTATFEILTPNTPTNRKRASLNRLGDVISDLRRHYVSQVRVFVINAQQKTCCCV